MKLPCKFITLRSKILLIQFIVMLTACLCIPDHLLAETSLNGTDNSGEILYDFRASKDINDRQLIEFEYARTRGFTSLHLPSGSSINLEENVLLKESAANIGIDFALQTASLQWGMKTLRSRWVKLNVYAGVRCTNFKTDLSVNNITYRLNDFSYGPTGSFEAIVPITDSLRGASRISAAFLPYDNMALSFRGQITLDYRPTPWADVFAGWYVWNYQHSEHRSNINLDTQGPAFGIKISF